jgi:membrane protein
VGGEPTAGTQSFAIKTNWGNASRHFGFAASASACCAFAIAMVALHSEISRKVGMPEGDLLGQVGKIYAEFSEDRIPAVAAGITFFFLLALFPAVAAIVSLYGIFADRAAIMDGLRLLSGFLPEGAVRVLHNDLYRLTKEKPENLGWAFLISFILAIWSASGGIKALIDGLNIAFETKETRSFLRITANALFFTAVLTVAAVLSIYVGVSSSKWLGGLPGSTIARPVFDALTWPVGFFLCSAIFSLIYKFGPNRPHARWKWISWGSAIASAAWILGTFLFSWYAGHFGRYDRIYGELGGAVGFLTWVWLSLVILLTGAEIVCEAERRE